MAAEFGKNEPIPAELDVFGALVPRSRMVETSYLEEHQPVNFAGGHGNQGDAVEFFVRGTEHWINLQKSYFLVRGEISGNDNVDTRTDAQVAANAAITYKSPANDTRLKLERNFVHTMFSSVSIYVCDKPVSPDNQGYPYAAYFYSLLNFSADYLETVGVTFGWADDDSSKVMYNRNKIEMVLQPRVGFFQSVKNLFPFVDFRVVFSRVTNPRLLFRHEADNTYKFDLKSMVFKVRKVKVWDEYTQHVEQQMSLGRELRYKLREPRVFIKTYTPAGTELIEDNIFHGLIPQTIVLGFVKSDEYAGTLRGSPFNFTSMDCIDDVVLLVNGMPFPVPAIRVGSSSGRTFEAYHTFMDALFAINSADPPYVTKTEYDTRSLLFAYNMAPDQYHGLDNRALADQHSNIRLHVKFSRTAAAVFMLVVMYESYFDMTITKHRMVTYGPSTYNE